MHDSPPHTAPHWRNKVAPASLLFWIIKMMSTTVGETAADYLNADLHLGLAATTALMGALLAVTLCFQLRARRYLPSLYWLTVVFVSVFGTLVTDNLSDSLGVPLALSTELFGLALLATFTAWYAKERTLSILSIDTPRRERFYWTAILLTFALGTAAGDLLAESLALGYGNASMVFGALIAVTALAHAAAHVFQPPGKLAPVCLCRRRAPAPARPDDRAERPVRPGLRAGTNAVGARRHPVHGLRLPGFRFQPARHERARSAPGAIR